ncbi:unnamed protein product [Sympodiomycopsis kandeliae]
MVSCGLSVDNGARCSDGGENAAATAEEVTPRAPLEAFAGAPPTLSSLSEKFAQGNLQLPRAQANQAFRIFLQLGTTRTLTLREIQDLVAEGNAAGAPPNYYSEASTAWILAHSSPSSVMAKRMLLGRWPNDLARDEYNLLRASLTMLLFPMSASAALQVVAVRPEARAMAKWSLAGTVDQEDRTLVRIDQVKLSASLRKTFLSASDLLDIFFAIKGDKETLHPIHTKDLVHPFRGSVDRGEFSAKVKAWLLGISLMAGLSLDERAAEGFYTRMEARDATQSAHLIHATRSSEWYEVGVIGREFCHCPDTTHQMYELHREQNGVAMSEATHADFDAKRWSVLPFPNAGFSAPNSPRPSEEVWLGVPIRQTRLSEGSLRPAEDTRIHVFSTLSPGSAPDQVPFGADRNSVSGSSAAANFLSAASPPAATLAYVYVSRHLGRSGALADELKSWISWFLQPLLQDEDLALSAIEARSAAKDSLSAASSTSADSTKRRSRKQR